MSDTPLSGDVRTSAAVAPDDSGVLRVETVFHDVTPGQADTIAAEMIAHAHELANMAEHGCDVDVNVRREPSEADGAGSV